MLAVLDESGALCSQYKNFEDDKELVNMSITKIEHFDNDDVSTFLTNTWQYKILYEKLEDEENGKTQILTRKKLTKIDRTNVGEVETWPLLN